MTAPDTERKLRELSFLREVTQLASSARDWDEMLRIVIDRTTGVMRAEVSSLYLLDRREGILRLVATNGLNRRGIGRVTLRLGEGISGWVANARVPLAAREARADVRWKHVPTVDEERFTSMLSVPLAAHDEVIGVMNVQTVEARDFDRAEIDFLQTIANQVAGIIEKGRLQRDAERKLREVSALFEVSNVLTSTLELDEVLSLVVDRLVRVYPGSSGAILMRDGDAAPVRARSGELARGALQAARAALAETRPIVEADHIALPLLAAERLLGAVVLSVPRHPEFDDEEIAFVGALANQAALAIDKAALYALERRTTERLRELERARAEFVAVVTHDLRTPLSVIRGHLDLLGGRPGRTADAVAQVERLDGLVDRILAGVRADSPELALRRGRFD
ncbi:MAG: GAF domain-containing protein, partial [Candidatus Limnocylindria bacterium]